MACMRSLIFFAIAGGLALTPQSVKADDHHDRGRKHWKDDHDDDRDRHRHHGDQYFRDEHLRVIHDYYVRDLPPGLAKKYYRTGRLPPGWERRVQPFPYYVERSLPPAPPGYARGYVDGYAVVYEPRTHAVIDFHAVLGR